MKHPDPAAVADDALRRRIRAAHRADEGAIVHGLIAATGLDEAARRRIEAAAVKLVRAVRGAGQPGMMETFLAEYGLTTREGIALMCLAEALLRVPDAETVDALISDKIAPADWGRHLGHSSSPLVNASTWALLLTGRVLTPDDAGLAGALRGVLRRLGEPVLRGAVGRAMREMGRQFVLGRTIEEAVERARPQESRGYRYSFDMLGEAARTEADARRYHLAYAEAIAALARHAGTGGATADRPGVSVKLSALHPRFEFRKDARVRTELVARVRALALIARSADMGFNIDAEEADRIEPTLDVVEAVLADGALAGWDGFGVVVQAYSRRAAPILDWLYDLAQRHDRRLMVRLVKGAYWDTEIKHGQVLGTEDYTVFTRKVATDASFVACAARLLEMRPRLFPQFATHNAHAMAAVLDLAARRGTGKLDDFEFQRLHGMGETLHEAVRRHHGTRCRIYAPVGAHRDLLAYLVRRLLENGANSSFVNQIVDERIAPEEIARDPFDAVEALAGAVAHPAIVRPPALFGETRRNARGWDLADPDTIAALDADRAPFRRHRWTARPMGAAFAEAGSADGGRPVTNPADPTDTVGAVVEATPADVAAAVSAAAAGQRTWAARPAAERAAVLRRAADLYEDHAAAFFALAAREAGKTLDDAVAEVREAVDFLRYYATQAEEAPARPPRGLIACISPWNFPLAIFTGQIAAALAAGNAVIAKPAEQTPLIAAQAVALLHQAGVDPAALHLLPGDGPAVGGPLVADGRLAGVTFTGSTETARAIDRAMAAHLDPAAPLTAETGGLNAMIVDSTALPEQTVLDIIDSAFRSAGQRCSALRILYLQADIAEPMLAMLTQAMDELALGDPWDLATDVGPAIDAAAADEIRAYCDRAAGEGRVVKALPVPDGGGHFVGPTVIAVGGIADLPKEIFGPVLHVARFEAGRLDTVIEAVNAKGYGLTFGLQTRIDARVQRIVDRVAAGNVYVNRNQIGAVVGSQPFGGEGLSGTGPKAGGPFYVRRFQAPDAADRPVDGSPAGAPVSADRLAAAWRRLTDDRQRSATWAAAADRADRLAAALAGRDDAARLSAALDRARLDPGPVDMPGPTGESNRLSLRPRGAVLAGGADGSLARVLAVQALSLGNPVLLVAADAAGFAEALAASGAPILALDGAIDPAWLADPAGLAGLAAVAHAGPAAAARAVRRALAARPGGLIAFVADAASPERFVQERHLCIDTTASGGNVALLAAAARPEPLA